MILQFGSVVEPPTEPCVGCRQATAAGAAATPAAPSIWPGVATGVTIFVLTSLLDVIIFRRRR